MTGPSSWCSLCLPRACSWSREDRTPAQLALIVAAVAMGAELWKIHATATYVTWYYPFLLLGFLCDEPARVGVSEPESSPACLNPSQLPRSSSAPARPA